MKPFFSVVIPTYNRAVELKRAIGSVRAQSFEDFEILVMDDGSTDNTCEIVASFEDRRVTYEREANSGGPARPRNRGISRARGEWICFLDADDWWSPNKLLTCFEHASYMVDLIYHDLKITGNRHSFFWRTKIWARQVGKPALVDLLLNGNPIGTSSVVVRKSLMDKIGGFDENVEMIASEDYNAWLRVAQISEAFCYIPKSLGYYTLHEGGISRKDMSQPTRCAVAGFVEGLNDRQKLKLESNLRYTKSRFAFGTRQLDVSSEDLLFALKHGGVKVVVKSMAMLFAIALSRAITVVLRNRW